MFKRDATDFDADNDTISIPNSKGTGNVDIGVFDKVAVRIDVEKDKDTQRGSVKMTLVRIRVLCKICIFFSHCRQGTLTSLRVS